MEKGYKANKMNHFATYLETYFAHLTSDEKDMDPEEVAQGEAHLKLSE